MLPNPKNKRDERDNTETTMDIQGYFVTLHSVKVVIGNDHR